MAIYTMAMLNKQTVSSNKYQKHQSEKHIEHYGAALQKECLYRPQTLAPLSKHACEINKHKSAT
jgi:hypothetical protein